MLESTSVQALLTDTVGFIQKLPTRLVAAFCATLEEIDEANLILHVVDISHPNAAALSAEVMQVSLAASHTLLLIGILAMQLARASKAIV